MSKLISFVIGLLVYPFRVILPIRRNVWIFGSDKGVRYSQNSKFLYEYVIKNVQDVECYWITQSKTVYKELKKRNLPVLYNWSYKGLKMALTAEIVVYSTWFSDILYTFPNEKRFFVYLMHGMPAKKIYYDDQKEINLSLLHRVKNWLFKTFVNSQELENMSFIPVTSSFFQGIVSKATKNENVYVTGQPRTDAFFSFSQIDIRKKYGFDMDDYIVTYMPTHRAHGRGKPSPQIFKNDINAIDYFNRNRIKIIWKQHINMLKNYDDGCLNESSCFVDFSKKKDLDSQELLFISDILITDYSSCYIDFMLLGKPLLFYFYDDYVQTENSLYISEVELGEIGLVAREQKLLFENLKCVHANCLNKDYADVAREYYSYIDDKACERTYEKICRLKNNKNC